MIAIPIKDISENANLIANKQVVIDNKVTLLNCSDKIGNLSISFKTMVENLSQVLLKTSTSSQNVASFSQELALSSAEVSTLSEEIAASVQQISHGVSSQSELSVKALYEL